MAANVVGSLVLTPYSRLDMTRVSASGTILDEGATVGRVRRMAFDIEAGRVSAEERNVRSHAGRIHAGQITDPLDRLLEESHLPARLGIPRRGQRHDHRQRVLRVKAGVNLYQSPEALDRQSRPDQEYERQGDLGDDQNASQALATAPSLMPLPLSLSASSFFLPCAGRLPALMIPWPLRFAFGARDGFLAVAQTRNPPPVAARRAASASLPVRLRK